MRIAVIGGTGNIGTATVRRLSSEGHEVVSGSRRAPSSTPDGVVWRHVDVAGPAAPEQLATVVRGAQTCVLAAWAIQPMRDPEYQARVGVGGLERTLRACAAAGVRHVVVMSSTGAYAPVRDRRPVDESHPVTGNPSCAYSMHKAAAEAVLTKAAHDQDRGGRMVISWLRATLVGQRSAAGALGRVGVSPLFPRPVLPQLPVMPVARNTMLQVVHAGDVAEGVSRLVASRVPGPFNLAAPDVLGPSEVAAPLGGRALRLPEVAVIRAADLAWAAHVWPLDPGWLRMAAEVPLVVCDRARTELGWRPRRSAADTWRELVEGMAAGDGGPTPVLRRRTVRDDLVQLLRGGPVTRRRRT